MYKCNTHITISTEYDPYYKCSGIITRVDSFSKAYCVKLHNYSSHMWFSMDSVRQVSLKVQILYKIERDYV